MEASMVHPKSLFGRFPFARLVLPGLIVAVVAGCGNKKGEASVDACEAWLSTMVCGETDHRDEFNCQIYAEQRCDVSPYFGCLAAKTECDAENSEFDFSGWDDCAVVAGCAE